MQYPLDRTSGQLNDLRGHRFYLALALDGWVYCGAAGELCCNYTRPGWSECATRRNTCKTERRLRGMLRVASTAKAERAHGRHKLAGKRYCGRSTTRDAP